VKKLNVLATIIAMLLVPAAFAGGVNNGAQNPNHVQGEKLDSGLGELGEFNHYCDPEFIGNALLGEKLDSGLGELTQAEIDQVVAVYQRTVAASNKYSYASSDSRYSRVPVISTPGVMSVGYDVPPSNEGE
jgi:hypothetical protein